MKKVLAGFDSSTGAEVALKLACEIALVHGGSVDALYVEDERTLSYVPLSVALGAAVGINTETPQPLPAKEMVQALEKVAEHSQKVRADFGRILEPRLSSLSQVLYRVPELSIERGLPWEVLAKSALSADYVVMGRVGADEDLRDLWAPETSEALAREIIAPLLLVTCDFCAPAKVLLAYDGSEPAQRAMRALPGLVSALGVESIVLLQTSQNHVPAEDCFDAPLRYLEQCGVPITEERRQGPVFETIIEVVKQHDLNMVAAGAFGDKGMRKMFWGSTTEALLSEQSISLLLSR